VLDAADESLSLPNFTANGLVETPSGFESRGVVRRFDPLCSPDFSRPIEAVNPICPHSVRPPATAAFTIEIGGYPIGLEGRHQRVTAARSGC